MALIDTPALARALYPRAADTLGPHALQVLVAIADDPAQSIGQLAQRLTLNSSSVSHAITQLKDHNYLREQPDPTDGRRRKRSLTGEGQRAVTTLVAHASDVLAGRSDDRHGS